MKSICIKTNNSNLLDYLLNELNYIEIEPVYISSNKFKSIKQVWEIQTQDEKINKFSAFFHVIAFAFNALKKHLF